MSFVVDFLARLFGADGERFNRAELYLRELPTSVLAVLSFAVVVTAQETQSGAEPAASPEMPVAPTTEALQAALDLLPDPVGADDAEQRSHHDRKCAESCQRPPKPQVPFKSADGGFEQHTDEQVRKDVDQFTPKFLGETGHFSP